MWQYVICKLRYFSYVSNCKIALLRKTQMITSLVLTRSENCNCTHPANVLYMKAYVCINLEGCQV